LNSGVLRVIAAAIALFAGASSAQDAMPTWEGLVDVKTGKFDLTFVAPGADFRSYQSLLIEPVQVTFHKDWLANNNSQFTMGRPITEQDAEDIAGIMRSNFTEIFTAALTHEGLGLTDRPAPGTLRVAIALVNLYINAPESLIKHGSMESKVITAGQATLVIELRDAQTGALLRRIMDNRETREAVAAQLATRGANIADFRALFKAWANESMKDLRTLQRVSPLSTTIQSGRQIY
jgi:hypothetical protein